MQDAGDGDPATSDGIFVYAPGGADVSVGDVVNVAGVGRASSSGPSPRSRRATPRSARPERALPAPTALTLPATPEQREALEGMYVTLPQSLTILEYFEFGRFGTIDVGLDRQCDAHGVVRARRDPGDALAAAERCRADHPRRRASSQNPDPAIHPNGEIFTLENTFRGGDCHGRHGRPRLPLRHVDACSPRRAPTTTPANPRPDVPEVGGDLTVASFNVLNYFTTIDPTTNRTTTT